MNKTKYWVGIDLGTTNSACFIAEEGTLNLRPILFDGELTLPSAVSKELVGKKALERNDPNDLVLSAKSWLLYGPDHFQLPLLNPYLTPEEATFRILKTLYNHVAEMTQDSSLETVITIPASFTHQARQKTENAAKRAGFIHVELLEEPLAAFYTLLHEAKPSFKESSKILIVDVGGGTTDFSIIEFEKGEYKRTEAGAHLLLGGDNMDLALLEEMIHDQDVSPEEYRKLLMQAKKKKETEPLNPVLEPFFAYVPREKALEPLPALKNVGLPFTKEPSIVKHLSHFLKTEPDHLVVNGGVFKRKEWAFSLQDTLQKWFKKPIELHFTPDLDLSCAKGAIYAKAAKKGFLKPVEAGLLKSYLLEIEPQKYLSILSQGTPENYVSTIKLPIQIPTHTPLFFKLFTSPSKIAAGEIVQPSSLQYECTLLAKLRYGKTKTMIPADLQTTYTAAGQIQLGLHSKISNHFIQLNFDTRSKQKVFECALPAETIEKGQRLIKNLFLQTDKNQLLTIGSELEKLSLLDRSSFPLPFLRALFDALMEVEERRHASSFFSEKWWQWAGYTLRPGSGYPLDEERAAQFYRIALHDKSTHEAKKIALRRASAGFKGGQQKELLAPFLKENMTKETFRLIGSFERLDLKTKHDLLKILLKKPDPFALARIGSRKLIYGSLAETLRPKILEEALPQIPEDMLYPILQEWLMTTGIQELALSKKAVERSFKRMSDKTQVDHLKDLLYQGNERPFASFERLQDSLPTGLEIDDMAST